MGGTTRNTAWIEKGGKWMHNPSDKRCDRSMTNILYGGGGYGHTWDVCKRNPHNFKKHIAKPCKCCLQTLGRIWILEGAQHPKHRKAWNKTKHKKSIYQRELASVLIDL